MKRFIAFFSLLLTIGAVVEAYGAANVLVPKKADSVAKRDASTTTSNIGGSLMNTAVNLATGVIALNQQQKALTAECEPSNRDITFVNNMIKEWAIAGGVNPLRSSSGGTASISGVQACTGSNTYANTVRASGNAVTTGGAIVCYDVFSASEARGAVWAGFPKAAIADYCSSSDDFSVCSKNSKKKTTNMWELFSLIDFDDQDYTRSEASQAQALRQKASNCSDSKLAAKRMESVGGFIQNTISNAGQPTNTGSIMQSVQGIVGQSGIGGLGGLATSVAGQFMDR